MAGLQISRVGDIGMGVCSVGAKCCPHVYMFDIITGADTVIVENSMAAIIGSVTSTTCPHCPIGEIITGNPTVQANNSMIARPDDVEVVPCGSGNIMTGAMNSFVDGN